MVCLSLVHSPEAQIAQCAKVRAPKAEIRDLFGLDLHHDSMIVEIKVQFAISVSRVCGVENTLVQIAKPRFLRARVTVRMGGKLPQETASAVVEKLYIRKLRIMLPSIELVLKTVTACRDTWGFLDLSTPNRRYTQLCSGEHAFIC